MPPKTKAVKEHVVFCDLYYKKVNNVSVADFFAIVNPAALFCWLPWYIIMV